MKPSDDRGYLMTINSKNQGNMLEFNETARRELSFLKMSPEEVFITCALLLIVAVISILIRKNISYK